MTALVPDRCVQALEAGDQQAAEAARERMWNAVSDVLGRAMKLGPTWNTFAARTADPPAGRPNA